MTPFLVSSNLLEWHTQVRKTVFLAFTSLLGKGSDERYRWTSRWNRCIEQGVYKGHGAFIVLRASLSPKLHMFTNLEALRELYFGIFIEASSHRHKSLTPFLSFLRFLENGLRAENSKLLLLDLFFWWPAPFQELPSHRIRTKDISITLKFQEIEELCSWNQSPNIRTKDVSSVVII